MIFSDLSFLLIPDVALEADDITKQVNQIMGGKKAPAEVKSDNQRDEDLTKTDNLFDNINKNDPDNDPVDTPQNDDDNNDTQDDTTSDANNDQSDNTDDPNNPDDGTDDQNMDQDPNADLGDDPSMPEEDKSIFSDKNTLKENMIYFFNIIKYTITSLEDGLGSTEDQETVRVINSVIHNLYNSKDILYKILTEEMESSSYETLVTKYITLKRIYDISCDMLEEHFSNNPNSRVKYKRFKVKKK